MSVKVLNGDNIRFKDSFTYPDVIEDYYSEVRTSKVTKNLSLIMFLAYISSILLTISMIVSESIYYRLPEVVLRSVFNDSRSVGIPVMIVFVIIPKLLCMLFSLVTTDSRIRVATWYSLKDKNNSDAYALIGYLKRLAPLLLTILEILLII